MGIGCIEEKCITRKSPVKWILRISFLPKDHLPGGQLGLRLLHQIFLLNILLVCRAQVLLWGWLFPVMNGWQQRHLLLSPSSLYLFT
jgi:hypothetical protein